VKAMIFPFCLQ